ncbi:MAG: EI24 domain-containing protein [Pseudomonadota bacterium]
MRGVLNAYGRALLSQLHGKMLLLSLIPFLLSAALWGLLLGLGFQPLIDYLHAVFSDYELFQYSRDWLNTLGLGVLKSVIVPLLAMLLLLPLMILTVLIFIGVAAMPAIVRHVGGRHYPQLEKKHGGSLAGSLVLALGSFLIFVLVWFLTLPLFVIPPLALLMQMYMWGWLTSRLMAYDALADYASVDELAQLRRERRWPLLAIGIVSGAAGALPGALLLGNTIASVTLFPLLAWLYVLIFIFTGLWFEYYCLEALAQQRAADHSITH